MVGYNGRWAKLRSIDQSSSQAVKHPGVHERRTTPSSLDFGYEQEDMR